MTESVLAQPFTLSCGQILPNRIAKAAMSEQLANRDGTATDELRRLYAVWARSGAGLLLSGNIMVDRDALTEPGNVILDDARDLDSIRAWTGAAHETDTLIWAQINHPGKVAVSPFNRRPVAPSARRSSVPGYNIRKPRELSHADIELLVAKFARTAQLAVAGGFDGVQIHAAHGYLLSQFLSPLANSRADEWGGTEAGRRKLLLDIVAAVRDTVGPRIPVSVKLNSNDFVHGGFSDEQARNVALALDDAGVDLLEISGGGYEQPAMTGVATGQSDTGEGYFADFARRIRDVSGIPLMLTGGLRSPRTMESLIGSGTVDVVGIGRPLTFAPTYPRAIISGHIPDLPKGAPRMGYRPADGYLELAWHNDQLHRIAAGKTPQRKPGLRTISRAIGRVSVAAAKQVTIPR
ncbi:putative oxidoreductase [Gordonia effusa NBRC 100432]|uniref:Putative oxidoreductase n=1 Tax=Gordonia effusa NBRC 100432 TaxID=1077974 RepID=H0QVY7_9ACTN|nr:NADH:flavin oxidoreductase/NADH oxidase family protein [Gordonia effusa]GAB16988.1 putative oxidoreductase [Gordonia effusa NBRC 100432]